MKDLSDEELLRTAEREARSFQRQKTLTYKPSIKGSRVEMKARFAGKCRACSEKIYVGDLVYFFPQTRAVEHYRCAQRRGTSSGR